jgi:hypothetical protein
VLLAAAAVPIQVVILLHPSGSELVSPIPSQNWVSASLVMQGFF